MRCPDAGGIAHRLGLGDLDDQARRWEVLVVEHAEQPVDDVEVVEVLGRQVDRQADRLLGERIDDVADQPARRLDHRQVELGDHVHLFGELDEAGRRDRTLRGAGPARERLDRRHGAGAQVDHRLEHGVDRPAVESRRRSSASSSARAMTACSIDGSKITTLLRPSRLPRYIAMSARRSSSSASTVLVVDHRHADRRADVEPAPAEPQRRPDRLGDLVGDRRGAVEVAVLEHHDEFVAAEARCRIAPVDRPLDPPGDLLQHSVAGRVAAPVVDRLEPVEVDEQHGERDGRAGRSCRCPA